MSRPKKNNSLSAAAKTLGHEGGLKGGPARSRSLTGEERSEIASEGAKAKHAKEKAGKEGLKAKVKAHIEKKGRGPKK